MSTDEKVRTIGKRIFTEVFSSTPCEDWDYCSSLLYQKKVVQYPTPYAYSFYDQEQFDEMSYAKAFKELYGERTEEAVWNEMKATLISDLQRCTISKDSMISIIQQY